MKKSPTPNQKKHPKSPTIQGEPTPTTHSVFSFIFIFSDSDSDPSQNHRDITAKHSDVSSSEYEHHARSQAGVGQLEKGEKGERLRMDGIGRRERVVQTLGFWGRGGRGGDGMR